MLLHNWSISSSSSRLLQSTTPSNRISYEATHLYSRRRKLKVSSTFASLRVGTDAIVDIAHNKVLIAAAVCAAVGQLAKPFTASILYRRNFDLKATFLAGGFPSTHSSATVATAMSLGLERGFSDSIFGLAVVYAALTMYDAQGVRREVGIHARTLNKVLTRNQLILNTCSSSDANTLIGSSSRKLLSSSESDNTLKLEETSTLRPELHKETLLLTSDRRVNSSRLTDDVGEESESRSHVSGSLKESIGHTEIEVAAGALLGLLGSLAIYSL